MREADAQELREMPGAGVRNPQAPAQPVPTPGNRTIVTVRGDDEAAFDSLLVRLLAALDRGEPIPWETLDPAAAQRLDRMLAAKVMDSSPVNQRIYLMERKRHAQVPKVSGTDDELRSLGHTRLRM